MEQSTRSAATKRLEIRTSQAIGRRGGRQQTDPRWLLDKAGAFRKELPVLAGVSLLDRVDERVVAVARCRHWSLATEARTVSDSCIDRVKLMGTRNARCCPHTNRFSKSPARDARHIEIVTWASQPSTRTQCMHLEIPNPYSSETRVVIVCSTEHLSYSVPAFG